MSEKKVSRWLQRDPGLVGASLERLADQLRDGWSQAKKVKLPGSYRQIDNVAVCGMGGSNLGADIIRTALTAELKIPVTIVADYQLPAWVNSRTLVICSSYSGGTEETITGFHAAQKRRAKIVVLASGGPLATLGRRHHVPSYIYEVTENPSGQPRLAVAYSLMALLACFSKLRLIKTTSREIERLPVVAREAAKRCRKASNPAREMAKALAGRIPLLIGSEWSVGNLHAWANQLHENAKSYAVWYAIPDLNHHLLEGLRNRTITKSFTAVIVADKKYHPRNQRRLDLTAKIVRQLGAKTITVSPRGATPLEKAIDLLAFGGYVSWYMAAYRGVLPAPIPTVDQLKNALAKK